MSKHWDWRTAVRMETCGKNCFHNRPRQYQYDKPFPHFPNTKGEKRL